ncbi:MAG: FlgD immunoglobulin-like domain containing protein, partial [Candidatus Zixiibacteriota bacterium]
IGGVLRNTVGNYGCTGQVGDFCHLTAIVSGRSSFLVYPNDPYANNSHLYVADGGNSRIVWLIKTTGGESVAWMSEAPTSQFIVDLETDIFGQLWAVDQYAGTITKYRYDLFPLCTFGSTGIGVNEFIQPISITNNGGYYGFGNMSVGESWTDSSGFQYFAIGTDVVDFAVTSSQSQSWHYIDFVLVDPSDVSVIVYDQQGGLVKTLFDGSQFSGPVSLVWDGTDGSNAPQPAGDYRVEVVDTCTYWNITTQAPVNVVTKEAWFHHEPPCCVGTRGDVNGDGADLDMVDLTCITDFLFGSGCVQPCPEEADPNGDTSVSDIVDMTFIVDWLFGNPPSLVSCP